METWTETSRSVLGVSDVMKLVQYGVSASLNCSCADLKMERRIGCSMFTHYMALHRKSFNYVVLMLFFKHSIESDNMLRVQVQKVFLCISIKCNQL